MSVKKILLGLAAWVLLCVVVIEPVIISPLFQQQLGWEFAQASLASLSDASVTLPAEPSSMSMDHFRVLCLIYFGLPALAYWLISTLQWEQR